MFFYQVLQDFCVNKYDLSIFQPVVKRRKVESSESDSDLNLEWVENDSYFKPLPYGNIQTSTPRVSSKCELEKDLCYYNYSKRIILCKLHLLMFVIFLLANRISCCLHSC